MYLYNHSKTSKLNRLFSLFLCMLVLMNIICPQLLIIAAGNDTDELLNRPHVITDWAWNDTYKMLQQCSDYDIEDADWVLNAPGLEEDDVQVLLPDSIIAVVDNSVVNLPVVWNLDEKLEYEDENGVLPDIMGEYSIALLTAETIETTYYTLAPELPDGYTLGETASDMTVLFGVSDIMPIWIPVPIPTPGETVLTDDALHFYIRHWHTDETQGAFDNGQQNGNRFFVVAEGYIVPQPEGSERPYKVYMRLQSDVIYEGEEGEEASATQLVPAGSLVELESAEDSTYISNVDFENGIVTLIGNPIFNEDDDEAAEIFSTFSISAGHEAVAYSNDSITIEYKDNVHLVKGHAFYLSATKYETGSNDENLFPRDTNDNTKQSDKERDVAYVYLYSSVLAGSGHSINEIVRDADGLPVLNKATLLDVLSETGEKARLAKVYNTVEGLHTDKTATAIVEYDSEGNAITRMFDMELNSWYAEGDPPQIGMILDASFSMDSAMDEPDIIKLSPEQIQKLGIHLLSEDPNENGGWDKYFLTATQINQILNKRYTDNSLLSVSGYSYFVGGGNSTYMPIGYWEGVNPKTSSIGYQFTVNEDADVIYGWPTNHTDLTFSAASGFASNTSREIASGDTKPSTSGILLDVAPQSGSFTISFLVKKTNSDSRPNDIASLLYIGPMNGDTSNGNFYHVYRDSGTLSSWLRGSQQVIRGNALTKFDNVFNSTNSYRVTLVFNNAGEDGGTVTSYISNSGGTNIATTNGTLQLNTPITEYNIILNGLGNEYNGSAVCIDDIYVIDEPLNTEQVNDLHRANPNYSGDYLIGKYLFNNNSALYENNGRDWLLNSVKENNRGNQDAYAKKLIGQQNIPTVAAPTIAKSWKDKPLGSININNALWTETNVFNHMDAGWYYITGSGSYVNHYLVVNTGKRLLGLNGSGIAFSASPSGTDYTYTSSDDTPIKFYVDEDYNLHCFYRTGADKDIIDSCVYELSDVKYVRTEALQRAIGLFATELGNASAASRISAVRFSADDVPEDQLNKLVLLNWTNDVSKSAKMTALTYGDGGATDDEDGQYNYGLTGSTTPQIGFKAFWENLALSDSTVTDSNEKYVIFFTDDYTEGTASACKDTVEKLKKAGYTIFAVLLDGETIDKETHDKEKAELAKLVGNINTTEADVDEYFFSVRSSKELMDQNNIDYSGINDTDILSQIFVNKILAKIVQPLNGYTMTEYLDPRFDFVDKYGVVWHLNGDGNVLANGKAYDLKSNNVKVSISNESTNDAQTVKLCYDVNKDMYYLVWETQTIPSCAVGSTQLSIWKAKYTVRAKDDFIGGNAVLTSGNDINMNWVYLPEDAKGIASKDIDGNMIGGDASSGTDDMYREHEKDFYPSKGFPRVVVNVGLSNTRFIRESDIFMGEELTLKSAATELIRGAADAINTTDGLAVQYAWDYLDRYAAKYEGVEFDDLIAAITDSTNKRIIIPYSYIPNLSRTNQTGGAHHEIGYVGWLEYKVVEVLEDWNILYQPEYIDINGERVIKRDADGNIVFNGESFFLNEKYENAPTEFQEKYGTPALFPTEDDDFLTVGRQTRTLRLLVNFYPLPLEGEVDWEAEGIDHNDIRMPDGLPQTTNRTNANQRLVLDADYKWTPDYKPADEYAMPYWDTTVNFDGNPAGEATGIGNVGKVQREKALIQGLNIIKLVSGEIDMLLKVDKKTVDELRDLVTAGSPLIYTANLMREYTYIDYAQITQTIRENVGTLHFTISNMNDAFLVESDGTTWFKATFTPTKEYMGYFADDDTQCGLPIGVYSLANAKGNAPTGYAFTVPHIEEDKSRYDITGMFTKGSDYDKDGLSDSYLAAQHGNDNSFTLGETVSRDAVKYTDRRFGLYSLSLGKFGNISIHKEVIGDRKHYNDVFEFIIKLSENNDFTTLASDVTGTYNVEYADGTVNTVTFTNGMTKVYLKHNESILIVDLPGNYYYQVTESTNTGYKQFGGNIFDGQIPIGDIAEVYYTNIALHSLTVNKIITGKNSKQEDSWEFTVQLIAPSGYTDLIGDGDIFPATLNGAAIQVKLKQSSNGRLSVICTDGTQLTLHGGDSFSINELPCGTSYEVVEQGANSDGYSTTVQVNTGNGTIDTATVQGMLNEDITITYWNSNPAGGIIVSKNVISPNLTEDKNEIFTFVIKAEIRGTPVTGTYECTYSDGIKTSIHFDTTGTAQIELKHDEFAWIDGFGIGTTITVTELKKDGFELESMTIKESDTNDINAENGASITVDSIDTKYEFAFVNERIQKRDLTIEKIVSGTMGNRDQYFSFTVRLTDKDGNLLMDEFMYNPSSISVTFENGVYRFSLKHGDSITLEGLPEGTRYEIVEYDADQYLTTITINEIKQSITNRTVNGVIGDVNTHVVYNNTRNSRVPAGLLPNNIVIALSILTLSIVGFACLCRLHKKNLQ